MSVQPLMIRVMVIEPDPLMRMGLVACLNQCPPLQVVIETDGQVSPIATLTHWQEQGKSLDLIVLSGWDAQIWDGCLPLKRVAPTVPILVIAQQSQGMTIAQQAGANGFCLRSASIAELLEAAQQVAMGAAYWPRPVGMLPASGRPSSVGGRWRDRLHQSGIQQIDGAIADLTVLRDKGSQPEWQDWVLAGRQRELRAARWVVNRLLGGGGRHEARISELPASAQSRSQSFSISNSQFSSPSKSSVDSSSNFLEQSLSIAAGNSIARVSPSTNPSASAHPKALQASVVDAIATSLQVNLYNLTETPLEIDILKDEKKRELFYVVLRRLDNQLDELRISRLSPEQLRDRTPRILLDLWDASVIEFFGKYSTILVSDRTVSVVDVLRLDATIVESAILAKIPRVADCLEHLLYQTPLAIDDMTYAVGTVEAMQRVVWILQNLLIQVANAVMQPLLNRFGDVVVIKQLLYSQKLLSSREIERFRNDLSWKYRLEKYFMEPTAIFESRHELFVIQDEGIFKVNIYAPRNEELDALSGIPLVVTFALEVRDAVSPRLKTVISFVGTGVVYLLTDVLGRGIGLVGRGIIKGIGNALSDVRLSRRSGIGK